jgi:cholesterol oxidase
VLKKQGDRTFLNPFLTPTADALAAKSVVLTHPLGGCRMASDAAGGVVDEQGRVFDTSNGKAYPGLYLADASIVPTALGLNPSLTISALALRVADTIVQEMKNEGA